MNIKEIAKNLVELCRKGEWKQAQSQFYHPEIISKEPKITGGKITKGLDAIFEKNKTWTSITEEVHEWQISEPLIADDYFCVMMYNDVTLKGIGRIQSKELCVYEVKDGKIVSEQFFHR